MMPHTEPPHLARRSLLRLVAVSPLAAPLSACGAAAKWHNVDITHSMPALAFDMTRATDGKHVTATDYRGQIVMLYFGYTNCPDVCPTTLSNIADVIGKLGKDAEYVHVLFVTVDPNRDTLARLKTYTAAFSPRMVGLRGTPDAIARLAHRYHVGYSVTPGHDGHPYEVTHSSTVYVFDASGAVRLLVPSMASQKPDIAGTAADLKRLVAEEHPRGLIQRILSLV